MKNINEKTILADVQGNWWTNINEMVKDLEELGYNVSYACEEYVVVEGDDEDDFGFSLELSIAGSTMFVTTVREVL